MSLPQVSPLSSPADLVRLYHRFFLLPHGDGDEAEASEQGTVLILPPAGPAGPAGPDSLFGRWTSARTAATHEVDTLLSRGQCPLALEATGALTSALVLDATLHSPEDVRSTLLSPYPDSGVGMPDASESATMGVRMAYAMAVVRFVNGVVDEFQTALYASSVVVLASKAGLPLWLVQIRHAATHQTCPPLTVLREAAVESLRWLHNTYWLPMYRWAQAVRPIGALRVPPLHSVGEMQARAEFLSARDQARTQNSNQSQDRTPPLPPGPLPQGWSAPLAFAPAPLGVTFVHD